MLRGEDTRDRSGKPYRLSPVLPRSGGGPSSPPLCRSQLTDLSKCSSRQDETLHAKTDTTLTLDQSGGLRLTKRQKLDNINLTGEHRLRQAFVRRSLAYDLANIGTYAVLDKWTQKLFERMNEPPLANYKFVSVEQVMNADKALWVKVSDSTRGRLNAATGTR